jgi:hypothetical protein
MIRKSSRLVVTLLFVFTLFTFLKNSENVRACEEVPEACYDTYSANGADTEEVHSPYGCAAGSTCAMSTTKHWKVYFLDGYDRTIDPKGEGEIYAGWIFDTRCRADFNGPTASDTGSSCSITGRWTQLTLNAKFWGQNGTSCVGIPGATAWTVGHSCSNSPIIIDVSGNDFNLTSAQNGVPFDIRANGTNMQLAWTAAGSDDAFLVLDRMVMA